ncbi:NUDIX domain-containing protein [Corynebacterium pseudotuberculosis]|uniref:NUDIX domain-containing protein n=2 Tax=Corynebacterium pseudotuberculosis TaxID=1719 RepID=D9QA68_CORP2|nr:NUDIX hydrolase [Corynebacterium pseudotuberculosis]ADK28764.1 NUDIX domain-containing protein [Corynebacterium pseudotuberculosis FRC41]ADL10444.1 NUDIX domain-containing protein [Corynebacterium pseudotuberculosis C231]ADL20849.1 NUDIX hydrolase [Corynebacterium pseudotuberculosis 1002]ADO26238.2 NUDIX domain-containing protein [Corynebacterium pseudotuberculosis I19]AEK92296.1 ADP-ribose pyrophosphatase (ADPRase) [Corynebacterium pseudotuberculosis PAT10]
MLLKLSTMAHHFTVTSSELLIDAPILAVRRDSVTMPNNSNAYREIVEHFGAVAVAAVQDEKIAMIKQYRHSVGQHLWELPAGLLDIADESPLRAAQRELEEEAGLAAANWEILVDLVTSPGFCDEAVRVYLAHGLSHVEQPEAQDEEADMTLEWIPLTEAVDMIFSGEIVNSIAISGILGLQAHRMRPRTLREADQPFVLRPVRLANRRKNAGKNRDLKTSL